MSRRSETTRTLMLTAVCLTLAVPAVAQGDEALSRECNRIYKSLCRDVPAGPEMLGKCYKRHPAMESHIPAKCTADFQTDIENYNDATSGR